MKRKRRRSSRKERAIELTKTSKPAKKTADVSSWTGGRLRYAAIIGIALIVFCTIFIYVQTVQVPPLDYEDSYYLLHNPYVNLTSAFSRFGAVWNEPYFANFHPVTTTTWLVDRALADKSVPFDGLPSFLESEKHDFSADRKSLTVHSAQPARAIVELVKWIDSLGIGLADIHLKRPSLEDVFIQLTGKRLRD